MKSEAEVDWPGIGLLAVGLGSLQYVLEEGQANDWFEDKMILRLAVLAGGCLVTMMWWELSPRNRHPVIDFRVLKNRALSSAIFLFIALGFGLYGGVYLYPLFVQTILGFTPTATGLALLPGGLATGFSAILCGRLLNGKKAVIDPRVMIVIGVCIFMVSMWQLGHLTTQSGVADTRTALLIRGFGLGFLFTPINQVAYASIRPQEAQQASGLINLARQLGGSFGIAILGTYLQSHAQFHRNNLVSHLNTGNAAVVARLDSVTHLMQAHGMGPIRAHQAALQALDFTVTRQAMTMSYNDGFLLILIIFAFVTPAVITLKKPAPGANIPSDAH
jgi:DHA2 family multidrug resistance protein